jgi:hypothetical protein
VFIFGFFLWRILGTSRNIGSQDAAIQEANKSKSVTIRLHPENLDKNAKAFSGKD